MMITQGANAVRCLLSATAAVAITLSMMVQAVAGPAPGLERKARALLALEQMRCALLVETLQQALNDADRQQDALSIQRAKDVLTTRAGVVLGEAALDRLTPKMMATLKTAGHHSATPIETLSGTLEARCNGPLNAEQQRLAHWRKQVVRMRPAKRRRAPVKITTKPNPDPAVVPVPSLQSPPRPVVNFGRQIDTDTTSPY